MACLRGVSGVLTTRKWRSYYPILIFSSLRSRYARAQNIMNYFYKTQAFPWTVQYVHIGTRRQLMKNCVTAYVASWSKFSRNHYYWCPAKRPDGLAAWPLCKPPLWGLFLKASHLKWDAIDDIIWPNGDCPWLSPAWNYPKTIIER